MTTPIRICHNSSHSVGLCNHWKMAALKNLLFFSLSAIVLIIVFGKFMVVLITVIIYSKLLHTHSWAFFYFVIIFFGTVRIQQYPIIYYALGKSGEGLIRGMVIFPRGDLYLSMNAYAHAQTRLATFACDHAPINTWTYQKTIQEQNTLENGYSQRCSIFQSLNNSPNNN